MLSKKEIYVLIKNSLWSKGLNFDGWTFWLFIPFHNSWNKIANKDMHTT